MRQLSAIGTTNGYETYRQLALRFSLPLGTRSIGYLTSLLKPKFDDHKFEESFLQWEFELAKYERDNGGQLPDNVKIAVLLNETKGALQQHLQLRSGTVTTYQEIRNIIIEYYRATSAISRMKSIKDYNGPQPMDIGAYTKGKGKKGKGKKGKKGKGK